MGPRQAGQPSGMAGRDEPARLGARATATPAQPRERVPPGTHVLDLGTPRAGLLHVPEALDQAAPAPLVVLLHGAGSDPAAGLALLRREADEHGMLLVAPASTAATWNGVIGRWGPDVRAVDTTLRRVLRRFAVDPGRLALGGFSDGASYALSLGLANGDVFSHLIAFSPGFLAPPAERGRPRVFVSHGTDDNVLRIDRCSRRLVPALRRAGYEVHYDEFSGGHVVPPEIAAAATRWLHT